MLLGEVGAVFSSRIVYADTPPQNEIIISEVSPGSKDSASQEFIELYNNTANPIALKNWKLQYASSSGTTWTTKVSWSSTDTHIIQPNGYFLLATTDYLTELADGTFASGLNASGGHVRLLGDGGALQDLIGWGSATAPLGQAASAPDAGQSLARPFDGGAMKITNDNATDFAITSQLTPKTDNVISSPGGGDQRTYPSLEISELLPNPAAPQTDANDEFIELHNPNDTTVDLTGYTLLTGSTDSHKYQIKSGTITPGGYLVFYSRTTHLSLSNSGGRATLQAPDGSQIDQTESYTSAPSGQSWIVANGQWQWTDTPTPGQPNVFTLAPAPAPKPAPTPGPVTTPSIRKSSTSSTSHKRSAGAVQAKNTSNTPTAASASPTTNHGGSLHPLVLAVIGALAVLYALYEYRHDLANTLYKLRRYRENRRASGKATKAAASSRTAFRFGRWQNHVRSWLGTRTWL